MTTLACICRGCGQPIAGPDDAVHLGHEDANSGPGCDIWAHRVHVDLVGPDPDAVRIPARVLVAEALRP
ncbi:hypothetical protein ACL02U_00265 [Streptomyces sp. MS06]|uniref:hypothetical protein n=1 Tax=Streptomyces sp. MS06 TaxID=3385974 RepID=UPI0039A0BD5F